MMWAADFDESVAETLENDCLELLVVQLPRQSEAELGDKKVDDGNGSTTTKSGPLSKSGRLSDETRVKSASSYNFCGLTRNLWSRNGRTHVSPVVSSFGKGEDPLPVFCVAAILIMNRHKIMRETRSIDDMIKV